MLIKEIVLRPEIFQIPSVSQAKKTQQKKNTGHIFYPMTLIISLGQNMGVQNVILPQGLYLFTLFYMLFLSFIHGFLPARGRKTDNIINMALPQYKALLFWGC